MPARDFLFELGAEEMPPRTLASLSEALFASILKGLADAHIVHGKARRFATPRRLAVLIEGLSEQTPPRKIERRGPPLAQGFDASGAPTAAALAFARSCGVEVSSLDTQETDQGAWLRYRGQVPGTATPTLLPGIVTAALNALPIAKRMRWGAQDIEFVRPVHWIVMLFGQTIVPAQILGLHADRITYGHRFHAPKPIVLRSPKSYERALERAKVIADFDIRCAKIRVGATRLGESLGELEGFPTQTLLDEDVLNEVTALTEWPVPLAGRFEARFLQLPREVVIATVQHHQRYFPVVGADGALTSNFITICNIESRDPAQVRAGNERVVRPRLSDAAFFWDEDRKLRLADHAARLASVTYQTKLGSYADKTQRIKALAESIGAHCNPLGGAAHARRIARAAELAKADLVTAMVGEFPELQGTMGRYYALAEGEDGELAQALEEQYLPRYSGDRLPQSTAGRALAIADRLDTLAGIFAIDQRPTGTRDPFGLRRAALGILRILFEARWDVDLARFTSEAAALQPVANPKAAQGVFDFLMDRLRGMYLDSGSGISAEMFDAVLAAKPRSVLDFDARLRALGEFLRLPDAVHLAAANKRIVNILKKIRTDAAQATDAALFTEPAESQLHDQIERIRPSVDQAVASGEYSRALQGLTALRPTVDAFFDQVMVMDDNPARRGNRIALLAGLARLIGSVADLARLPV